MAYPRMVACHRSVGCLQGAGECRRQPAGECRRQQGSAGFPEVGEMPPGFPEAGEMPPGFPEAGEACHFPR